MKTCYKLVSLLVVVAFLVSCGATPTPVPVPTGTPKPPEPTATQAAVEPTAEPTAEPTVENAPPTDQTLTCAEPIKIGLITDKTGALALYGEMIERSFLLGMEYMAGAPGTEDHVFKIDECEIQVLIRDDQSTPDTTATVARELIDVENVNLLVGTTSSGATATLQQVALDNDKILIVAPAAANEITGANFNDHTFRVSRTNYHDAVNQCEYMTTLYKTYVQIAPDYALAGAVPRPSATPAPSSAASSSPTTSLHPPTLPTLLPTWTRSSLPALKPGSSPGPAPALSP